ncbi:MAG: SDR family oxidoreductase [Ilumatobacter fluminis]|uniref:NAD(P)-dependent dehydrogenase (Short-subunit alcohol dehydrogenase family) n=1 Tax=Ilumatobacter fluminis TaxID=467091 RepID=A0A4R7HZI8_9ACTN|nr:SDR family oxidoreductase [Ilumatobacter fluminis]TDT16154.1 NAD(P)-dependent dehydrogenase (short-subunit alcohol dehydrogenase family) [Ilumatobacter fluminis]
MTEALGFDGKVAIITGAGGGLGREHALMMASRGALVVVNDLGGAVDGTGSDKGAAERVVDEIKEAGGEAVADTNSVATPEGGAAIVQTAIDAFGRIDIVVNNAGILRDKSFHNMTPDLWAPVVDVHLNGAYHVTAAAWPHMREQSYGRIVSTASGAGIFGNFGQANYGAAKMALVGFTNVLAIEGASKNIKANVIAPVAKTRMTEDLLGPLGEKVAPQYVSPIVTYLAHESCEPTGRIFSVAGGRVAEIFIGEGPGFTDPDLSPESIASNFDQVTNRDTYDVPNQMGEEIGLYLKHLS